MAFWDRVDELERVGRWLGRGRFGVITGRRRVGKTALLLRAKERWGGLYHQAVEGTPRQQLLHATEELREFLPIFRDVSPKSWAEFLRLLSRERLPRLLIFDEFPYWVQGDLTLPGLLQKWIDHDLPRMKTLVLVSGSSQSMLHSQFLNPSAPLYGRASLRLQLEPMGYAWFCRALRRDPSDPESFARFSLVGGVPHYWRLMPKDSWIGQAQALYFDPSAILADEPVSLLRDEGITGSLPKAILDLVGRGVTKPNELAARLGTAQGNLSRPLALLLDLGLLQRELPFGESARTTKRVLYHLQDPALSFYYSTFLPFRSRWPDLSVREKKQILNGHVSRQWENFCRQAHPGSGRYWEREVEIDLVAYQRRKKRHLVAECKWARLSPREETDRLQKLQGRFRMTRLSRIFKRVDFKLLTPKDLPRLARGAQR